MKRFLLILFSIISAGVIVWLSINRSPFGRKNTSFASVPKDEITRVVLSRDEHQLVLENMDGKWMVDGQLETRKSSISHILRILKEMSIKSPVSPEFFDTALVDKRIEPVRVRVYEKRKQLNDFLVYKTPSNVYGNIMKKDERAKPFIVSVQGEDADIGSAFTLNALYWQPYTIFNFLPSEIESVKFENLKDTTSSFSILRSRSEYVLLAGEKTLSGWDTNMIKRYLTYFTYIPFERWALEMDDQHLTQVLSSQPAYRITVVSSGGMQTMLSLWDRLNKDGSRDTDRMYGKTGSSDLLFIVRYFDIDPILKSTDYFFSNK
jgi:hypothetical protein